MNKKVTVFGGSGFLGSHICDELTKRGFKITIFDTVKSPYLQPNQQIIVGDILDEDAVFNAVKGADYVYNFIAIADIAAANKDARKTATINIMGSLNVLEACRQHKVKRYIFSSSMYVYSNEGGFYRASKKSSEHFIEEYSAQYGLDFNILRFGSLYGQRADKNNRIYKMIEQAKQGTIDCHGADSKREFIHAKDAAKVSVDILADEHKNRHLIITGQDKISVKQLAETIAEIMPNNVKVNAINDEALDHYKLTPYSFTPKFSHKIVSNDYVDLGQGLLDCITAQHLDH